MISSRNSKSSICESEEWKMEHDYRTASFSFDSAPDLTKDLTRTPEHFQSKHKYLSLIPSKDDGGVLVVVLFFNLSSHCVALVDFLLSRIAIGPETHFLALPFGLHRPTYRPRAQDVRQDESHTVSLARSRQ